MKARSEATTIVTSESLERTVDGSSRSCAALPAPDRNSRASAGLSQRVIQTRAHSASGPRYRPTRSPPQPDADSAAASGPSACSSQIRGTSSPWVSARTKRPPPPLAPGLLHELESARVREGLGLAHDRRGIREGLLGDRVLELIEQLGQLLRRQVLDRPLAHGQGSVTLDECQDGEGEVPLVVAGRPQPLEAEAGVLESMGGFMRRGELLERAECRVRDDGQAPA